MRTWLKISIGVVYLAAGLSTAAVAARPVKPARVATDKTIDLLRQPGTQLLTAEGPGVSKENVCALLGGNTGTALALTGEKGIPMTVSFEFQEGLRRVESVQVQLEVNDMENLSAQWCGSVEVLVSAEADQPDYTLVLEQPLLSVRKTQTFQLPPNAAKWVMIRVNPWTLVREVGNQENWKQTSEVRMVKMALLGHTFGRADALALQQPAWDPAKLLEKFGPLLGGLAPTPEEKNLFEDAQDGRLDFFLFPDAALLASGVTDPAARSLYLKKIQTWQDRSAEAMVGAGSTPKDRLDALLRWMHTGILTGGYYENQTELSKLLDCGRYNCVSATIMFNLLARARNFLPRVVEVPGHVFTAIEIGDHRYLDVENTVPYGVDPLADERVAMQLWTERKLRYYTDKKVKGRIVSDLALITLIYQNRGGVFLEKKKYPEALLAFFNALSIDRAFNPAVRGIFRVLQDWSKSLAEDKQFQEAHRIVQLGLDVAPRDPELLKARRKIYLNEIDEAQKQHDLETVKKLTLLAESDLAAKP
jgi:hypothetical protein